MQRFINWLKNIRAVIFYFVYLRTFDYEKIFDYVNKNGQGQGQNISSSYAIKHETTKSHCSYYLWIII